MQRQASMVPVLISVIAVVGVLVIVFLALATRGGISRATPEAVHQRVIKALETNDASALFNELDPEISQGVSPSDFSTSFASAVAQKGQVIRVTVVSPPIVKTNPPWNGEWADGEVEVVRQRVTERYIVRFHLVNGQWWLYGTITP